MPIFAYAGYKDIQERKVSQVVWWLPLIVAVASLAIDVFAGNYYVLSQALANGMLFVALGILYAQFEGWGLADTKALVVISLLFPVHVFGGMVIVTFPITVFVFALAITGVWIIIQTAIEKQIPNGVPFLVPVLIALMLALLI